MIHPQNLPSVAIGDNHAPKHHSPLIKMTIVTKGVQANRLIGEVPQRGKLNRHLFFVFYLLFFSLFGERNDIITAAIDPKTRLEDNQFASIALGSRESVRSNPKRSTTEEKRKPPISWLASPPRPPPSNQSLWGGGGGGGGVVVVVVLSLGHSPR